MVTVGNRQNDCLFGREPKRECTGEMLNQNADEAFDRAEHHAVNHNRAVFLAVRADIFRFKALRQLEVELNGAALPGAPERIFQMEVDFRAVESTVTLVDHIGKL